MTSPDYQILNFELEGAKYSYTGSSGSIEFVEGRTIASIKPQIDAALKRIVTNHIPAEDQLRRAFIDIGYKLSEIPNITRAKNQPDDDLPKGAES